MLVLYIVYSGYCCFRKVCVACGCLSSLLHRGWQKGVVCPAKRKDWVLGVCVLNALLRFSVSAEWGKQGLPHVAMPRSP